MYTILNTKIIKTTLSSSLTNADTLKVSKILKLNFFNDKLFLDK
jgi:hypothetical protein